MALTALQIIALLNVKDIGPVQVLEIGNSINGYLDSDELFKHIQQGKDSRLKKIISKEKWDEAYKGASRLVKKHEALGIKVLGYYHEDFPECLRSAIQKVYKKKDREENDYEVKPVLYFYYLGNLELLKRPIVNIVSTDFSDDRVINAAKKVGSYLSSRGVAVLSSLDMDCREFELEDFYFYDFMGIIYGRFPLDYYVKLVKSKWGEACLENTLFITTSAINSEAKTSKEYSSYKVKAALADAAIVAQMPERDSRWMTVNTIAQYKKCICVMQYKSKHLNDSKKMSGNAFFIKKNLPVLKVEGSEKKLYALLDKLVALISKQ